MKSQSLHFKAQAFVSFSYQINKYMCIYRANKEMSEERHYKQVFADASWFLPTPPSECNTDSRKNQFFLLRKAITGTAHTHKPLERDSTQALGKSCKH